MEVFIGLSYAQNPLALSRVSIIDGYSDNHQKT